MTNHQSSINTKKKEKKKREKKEERALHLFRDRLARLENLRNWIQGVVQAEQLPLHACAANVLAPGYAQRKHGDRCSLCVSELSPVPQSSGVGFLANGF